MTSSNPAMSANVTVSDQVELPAVNQNEEDIADIDSSYGDDLLATLLVIREYREVHGRTFHKYGSTTYLAPNDETQNENLDIMHHMFTLLLDGKLFLAPINPNVQQVLDVATGTGIWAIDFGDEFPSANVIGTDVSPIQPHFVPPNVQFVIDDAALEWTWADNYFDFTHLRMLSGSIKDWPHVYREAYGCTKPGGFIEHLDSDTQFISDDGSVKAGDTMYEWAKRLIDIGENVMHQTLKIAHQSKTYIEEAGFVDVVQKTYKLPVGPWMAEKKWKELGKWCQLVMMTGLSGMHLYMLKVLAGWGMEEIQVLEAEMRAALMDKKNHGYCQITVVYGRKPE